MKDNTDKKMLICIPGPWENHSEFIEKVVTATKGKYMFAGAILACPDEKNHIPLELYGHDENILQAFSIAGQGKLSEQTLEKIKMHSGVAYLCFPIDLLSNKEMVINFTRVMQETGGYVVKIESTGIAHDWDVWFENLKSVNPFDQYRTFVILLGDDQFYYSCGMHHFLLPESQISTNTPIESAADTLNRFNYYQIIEKPDLQQGHTFSLTPDSPYYKLNLRDEQRYTNDESFYNPYGIWTMESVEQ